MAEQTEAIRDVVVVGGGASGLSATLALARARRSVTVVDAGEPRNAPAHGVHGLLGLEGVVVSTQMATRAEPFAGIGIEPTPHPAGAFIETDQFGATSVPGAPRCPSWSSTTAPPRGWPPEAPS